MADYNSFVLEGIKIIFADNNKGFIKEIYGPLINILCIEEYYSATGIYKGSSQKTENKAR
ncbi:hypothetical protein AAA17_000184 [Salmonella enterica subsp. enterica serovar Ohio]|uniref:hypothetical protein n=1 Tax=Enterobacter kobei TaxID=208224 RepID=UPI0018C31563|nr:hypothetical protein [Enterobacter kobei]EDU9508365.1 hypothetical protein [Salmonella enterica subsp. enterica serovar Ohio]EDW2566261.1 hypothetical protein [Salmonella enterica subsp. enterica serovar Ohio]EED9690225.1 hypothetical protein [Salmonella enterica subsp. enterica serovar Ohio]MBG0589951.1 hypothetical protein [Enterobacter kobei]MEB2457631.1 hypothetical protein [Enterobacter kobei]